MNPYTLIEVRCVLIRFNPCEGFNLIESPPSRRAAHAAVCFNPCEGFNLIESPETRHGALALAGFNPCEGFNLIESLSRLLIALVRSL